MGEGLEHPLPQYRIAVGLFLTAQNNQPPEDERPFYMKLHPYKAAHTSAGLQSQGFFIGILFCLSLLDSFALSL